jgi:hypothetical protein
LAKLGLYVTFMNHVRLHEMVKTYIEENYLHSTLNYDYSNAFKIWLLGRLQRMLFTVKVYIRVTKPLEIIVSSMFSFCVCFFLYVSMH